MLRKIDQIPERLLFPLLSATITKKGVIIMAEMEYLSCPFCSWCRPIKYGGRVVSFTKVDPAKVKVWQLRDLRGAGKGSKNASITMIDSKTLSELPQELKNQVKNQCQRILQALED